MLLVSLMAADIVYFFEGIQPHEDVSWWSIFLLELTVVWTNCVISMRLHRLRKNIEQWHLKWLHSFNPHIVTNILHWWPKRNAISCISCFCAQYVWIFTEIEKKPGQADGEFLDFLKWLALCGTFNILQFAFELLKRLLLLLQQSSALHVNNWYDSYSNQ